MTKKYRIVAGKHYRGAGEDREVFLEGDIIESDNDLLAFNQPGCIKFELVDSTGKPTSRKPVSKSQSTSKADNVSLGDGLEDMTVNELRAMAEEEEIDLGSASRKDEIIKSIRAAMVSTAAVGGHNS